MSKKDFIIPVPGTASLTKMESNFKAGEIIFRVNEIDELPEVLTLPSWETLIVHKTIFLQGELQYAPQFF